MQLERTDVAQQDFDRKTGEIPIVVSNKPSYDMFRDDTPLACGIENPDDCEACT